MSATFDIIVGGTPYTVTLTLATITAISTTTVFTPTTPADWPTPPANAQAALDGLANRVTELEDNPGGGDVAGPASSTTGNLAAFADETGKVIEDSGVPASDVVLDSDSRLTDARTPTAHAASHATGQSDPITAADIGAATAAQGSLADSAVQPGDLTPEPSWIPAAAMAPAVTNGALANSREVGGVRILDSWDFITAATRTVTVQWGAPKLWTGTTVACRLMWSSGSGTSGQFARWGVAAVALQDGDSENVAYGTAQTVDDALGSVDTWRVTDATPTITVAGATTTDRVVSFRIQRIGGSDDLPGSCRLLGIYVDWL
jgi:hypothetical protein